MNAEHLDISNFLPHRNPFLFVDKVLTIDDEYVSTSFTIKAGTIFIENNYLNEIGLIENAAQTCSSIVGKSYFDENDLEGKGTKLIGYISGIKKIKVYDCPRIGDTIISKAVLKSRMDTEQFSICSIDCSIQKDQKELLSCEMKLIIQEIK